MRDLLSASQTVQQSHRIAEAVMNIEKTEDIGNLIRLFSQAE